MKDWASDEVEGALVVDAILTGGSYVFVVWDIRCCHIGSSVFRQLRIHATWVSKKLRNRRIEKQLEGKI